MSRLLHIVRRVWPLYQVMALVFAKRVVVNGRSMSPCLAPGEYVLFDRLAYRTAKPARGDVVLAYRSQEPQKPLIKRVVGLPHERVSLRSGRTFINDRELEEPYAQPDEGSQEQTWHLKEEEYLLLGDARSLSTDSRTLGSFHRNTIKAKAWLVYWPRARWRVVHSAR